MAYITYSILAGRWATRCQQISYCMWVASLCSSLLLCEALRVLSQAAGLWWFTWITSKLVGCKFLYNSVLSFSNLFALCLGALLSWSDLSTHVFPLFNFLSGFLVGRAAGVPLAAQKCSDPRKDLLFELSLGISLLCSTVSALKSRWLCVDCGKKLSGRTEQPALLANLYPQSEIYRT